MAESKAGRNGEPGPTGASSNGGGAPHVGNPPIPECERYLVAARPPAALAVGAAPLNIGRLTELIEAEPEMRVVDRIGDADPAPGVWPSMSCPPVLVVEATRAAAARCMASPQLMIEPDAPLAYSHPNPIATVFAAADPAVLVSPADENVTIVVRGVDETPLDSASVYLIAGGWPVCGTTDKAGRVTLRLPAEGTVTGLWIRPRAGYWPIAVDRPHLSVRGENVIVATPLEATFEGFPKRKASGWSFQALRLHEIPPTYRGHGVKIALIDSGVAGTHPGLNGRIAAGIDVVSDRDRTWEVDTLGHGTACAGIISAADNEEGIDGVAVDAEVHAVKAMPGGRLSHLLAALDYCIRQQIDIAQISVGTLVGSALVALKIADARNAGVLCVASAGNTSAGPVTFPASLPGVLAVGAVGRVGTFPPGSHHPADLGPVGPDGLFVPGFTPTGPEVDVCAPGVAVICTVPPDGYAVLDGTGIAAAHITALAGLVLAHHEDFRARYTRGPVRVDRLAHLISASCQPVTAHRTRTGAGLPDARSALAATEPIHPDWAGSVLSHLHVELTRAGLIPAGPEWPSTWTPQ